MRDLLRRHPGIALGQIGVGEAIVARNPTAVTTVLGSCVAVTFYCPLTRIGAIFHALMPTLAAPGRRVAEVEAYKYVDEAIRRTATNLYRHGVRRPDLVCKVFGGANAMFAEQFGVGRKNVLSAFETLERERLRVAASDVGGDRGRKLVYLTHTGEVFLKRLSPQHQG